MSRRVDAMGGVGCASRRTAGPALVLLFATLIFVPAAQGAQKKFEYSGEQKEFKVPLGVTSLEVTAIGGSGGTGEGGSAGGRGAIVKGDLAVKERETLYVLVGGTGAAGTFTTTNVGGFNGGGGSKEQGGGGGGASDVRTVPMGSGEEASLLSRLIVAAGGGGGGSPEIPRLSPKAKKCAGGRGGEAGEAGEAGEDCGFLAGGGGGAGGESKGGEGGAGFEETTSSASWAGEEGKLGMGGLGVFQAGGGGGGLFGGGGGGGQGVYESNGNDGGSGGGGGGSDLVPKGGTAGIDEDGAPPSIAISYVANCSQLSGFGYVSPHGKAGENLTDDLNTSLKGAEELTLSTARGESPPYVSLATLEEAECGKGAGEALFSGKGTALVKGKPGYSMTFTFRQTGASIYLTVSVTKGASIVYSASEALISEFKDEKIS